MKNAAAVLGWKYKIIDGQLNANNGYAVAVRQALALKPDAIVVHGIGCNEAKQSFLEAKAQKVPVLAIESADCDDPLTPGGATEGLFEPMQFNDGEKTAGDFFAQWGRLQAAYVVNATQGKAQVLRTFQPGQVFAQHLAAGQSEILKKCAGCKLLDEVKLVPQDAAAGGPGVQKFTTMLARYPNANAAIFNYDGTAVSGGFAKAVADAGRARTMVTVGGEGYAPALQLIREGGGLTADPAHSGKWLAWGAADSLNRLFNGKPLVPQGIGFRLVDKDNNMAPGDEDYEPPIDYRSVYRKSWGVK
jgi:ribose transport system substrate-binding protein